MDTNDELFLVLDDTMDEEYGKKERTAEYGFFVSGKMYYVICHYQDNEWIVCNECTKFH